MLRTFFFGRLAEEPARGFGAASEGLGSRCATRSNGVSALVRANYYGKALYKPDNPTNDEVFGAKVLFDVDLGYSGHARTCYFALGADNLFNTFPDTQTKDANINFGRFIYSRNVSQFGHERRLLLREVRS